MYSYKAIALFGSANEVIDSSFKKPVYEIGQLLAQRGITLIYGVGDEGLMGQAYQGVRSENGKVLGITIPSLLKKQCADPSIFAEGELKIVDTLHDRKHLMMEGADALLIAPGGWGTLDEVASFGVHTKIGDRTIKPVIFLNFNGFWNPLKQLLQNMVDAGALTTAQIAFIDYAETADQVFEAIERVQKRLQK